MKNIEGFFPSRPARNERGESWREGKLMKNIQGVFASLPARSALLSMNRAGCGSQTRGPDRASVRRSGSWSQYVRKSERMLSKNRLFVLRESSLTSAFGVRCWMFDVFRRFKGFKA